MHLLKRSGSFIGQLWQTNTFFRSSMQLLAVVIPFYLMGNNLFQNWQLVKEHNWTIAPLPLILSFSFLFGAFFLMPLITRQSMSLLNYNLSYRVAYRAYFLSQLAKYLPGGIWVVPGRILFLQKERVTGTATSLGILLELYVMVMTGLLMSIPYLVAWAIIPVWLSLLLTIGLIGALVLLRTQLLSWLLSHFSWFRTVRVNTNWYSVIYVIAVSFVFWSMLGTGFFWLVRGLEGIEFDVWFMMIAAYSMAWVAGFLVFLTPGGLGVREATLAFLLSSFMPLPVATLIALLARVWWSIAEIVCVVIATMLKP